MKDYKLLTDEQLDRFAEFIGMTDQSYPTDQSENPQPSSATPKTKSFRRGSGGDPFSKGSPQHRTRTPLTAESLREFMAAQGIRVRYDDLTHELCASGTGLPAEHSTEQLSTMLFSMLREDGGYTGVNLNTIENYISLIAVNDRFNPVRELLMSVKWDGTDRLPDLYAIMRIENDELSKKLTRKWLMQTIALSCFNETGLPFGAEGVLTLCGRQGIGKTTLIGRLGLNVRLCKLGVNVDPHSKDDMIQATGCFICELGELESTMKRDLAALKAFLTAHTDEVRRPYARAATRTRRRTSFAASCNSRDFLADPTGNRRFFTIPCERRFDLEALARFDMVQLWAQVYAGVSEETDKSACFRLDPDELKALCERNGGYTKTIPAEQEVRDILDDAEQNPAKYEWKMLTVTDWAGYWLCLNRYNARQIGKALEQCGVAVQTIWKGSNSIKVRRVPVYKKRDTYIKDR